MARPKYKDLSDDILATIDRVVYKLAPKFKFGYYELEDIHQEGRIFALEALDKHDGVRPLENFLYAHVHNRLFNLKRKEYFRPEKPCDSCPLLIKGNCTGFDNMEHCIPYKKWIDKKELKKNLADSAPNIPQDLFLVHSNYTDIDLAMDGKNLFEIVDKEMPIKYRQDWIKFCNNTKLALGKQKTLLEVIGSILEKNNIKVDDE